MRHSRGLTLGTKKEKTKWKEGEPRDRQWHDYQARQLQYFTEQYTDNSI